ncbi:hypothetical protein ABE28_019760 [Peribacillus muralis]|uniref:Uncharacterized protein n=1 Tax=Peribacillus muralis TaxID=264697 RepID=A0A1B3XTR8_9BACI|nr:hypothetical protein ABE28_019760 [Peribacillus muralis]
MEIIKNAKLFNTICILLVMIHMLVLFTLVFMTDKWDTRFGQIGSLIVLVLGIYFCNEAFKIKSPLRHTLLVTTFLISVIDAIILLVFFIACV